MIPLLSTRGGIMTKQESIQKLQQIIKKIDYFYGELKAKYPKCENNLEMQGFISYSQFIKADCMRKIEQFSRLSDADFAKMPTIDFQMRNAETSFKSIDIQFRTLMNNTVSTYTPSDPSKTFPPI